MHSRMGNACFFLVRGENFDYDSVLVFYLLKLMSNTPSSFPRESFVVPREVIHRRLCENEGVRRTDVVVTDSRYDMLSALSLDAGVEAVRVQCLRVLDPKSGVTAPGLVDFSKYALKNGLTSRRAVPQSIADGLTGFSSEITGREYEVCARVALFLGDVILRSKDGKDTSRGHVYDWLLHSPETYVDLTMDDLHRMGISLRTDEDPAANPTLACWIETSGEKLTELLADDLAFAAKKVRIELACPVLSKKPITLALKLDDVRAGERILTA